MLMICGAVTVVNVGLVLWIKHFGKKVTPFQSRMIRLLLNALADGALILLYVDEVPIWCLSLTGEA